MQRWDFKYLLRATQSISFQLIIFYFFAVPLIIRRRSSKIYLSLKSVALLSNSFKDDSTNIFQSSE